MYIPATNIAQRGMSRSLLDMMGSEPLLQKKRTLPRYWRRIERPWFRKGQSLLKELKLSAQA